MARVRGITVVGCGLDSGEARVAVAALAAARASGEDARLFVTALIGAGAERDAELVSAADPGASAPRPAHPRLTGDRLRPRRRRARSGRPPPACA